jgi:hypothetical protein
MLRTTARPGSSFDCLSSGSQLIGSWQTWHRLKFSVRRPQGQSPPEAEKTLTSQAAQVCRSHPRRKVSSALAVVGFVVGHKEAVFPVASARQPHGHSQRAILISLV